MGKKMIVPSKAFPVYIVDDIQLARSYYVNNFSFDVAFSNEWYLHLVSNNGIQVAFMLPNQETQPGIFHAKTNGEGVIFSIEVENADIALKKAKENALDIVLDIKSEDWGQRHFAVKDPNGLYIDVVQAIAPNEDYEKSYTN